VGQVGRVVRLSVMSGFLWWARRLGAIWSAFVACLGRRLSGRVFGVCLANCLRGAHREGPTKSRPPDRKWGRAVGEKEREDLKRRPQGDGQWSAQ